MSDWVTLHPDDVVVVRAADGQVLGYRVSRSLLHGEEAGARRHIRRLYVGLIKDVAIAAVLIALTIAVLASL